MARPVPGGEFTDAVDGMVADAGQNIPEIGLGIKAIEPGGPDQGVDCQSARKVEPGSASNIDPLVVRDGERPTGCSWSGLRSPVGRVVEAFRL